MSFQMIHKLNHVMCSILGLAFFIQYNSLEINPSRCAYQGFISFYCWIVAWICHNLTIHLLKYIWTNCSLGLLQVKLLWTFTCRFLCKHKFSFFWDIDRFYALSIITGSYGICTIRFIRKSQTIFQMSVLFYIHISMSEWFFLPWKRLMLSLIFLFSFWSVCSDMSL